MRRRPELLPWRVAGRLTEAQGSADEVVQTTGWVFNNETGDTLTLAEFVATGDTEVAAFFDRMDLRRDDDESRTMVEIGCGIGRMTCAFTRRYSCVYACDLDAGFLERCREAVAQFGKVDRLRTIEVADGRTLEVPDGAADLAFSYITLQHCERDDAMALMVEALRAVGPGGRLALNFRSWSGLDPIVLPLGVLMRGVLRLPGIGRWLLRFRLPTRLAWQVNRLDPHQVVGPLHDRLTDVVVWRNPARRAPLWGIGRAELEYFDGVNRNHWWLVATVK